MNHPSRCFQSPSVPVLRRTAHAQRSSSRDSGASQGPGVSPRARHGTRTLTSLASFFVDQRRIYPALTAATPQRAQLECGTVRTIPDLMGHTRLSVDRGGRRTTHSRFDR